VRPVRCDTRGKVGRRFIPEVGKRQNSGISFYNGKRKEKGDNGKNRRKAWLEECQKESSERKPIEKQTQLWGR